jgi:5-methylcytosine-specific restriction endonuclease McrA
VPEGRPTAAERRAVAERARGCCEYCRSQERFSADAYSVEHVTPRSAGGGGDAGNLAFSCQGCNNRKYNSADAIDPVTGERVPLFHPRLERWETHFAWNEDLTVIVALTPVGRATLEKLQLNRPGVVNLRRVLRAAGEHPPQA